MQTVRCYLPLSLEQLQQLHRERQLSGPLAATTVTDEVRSQLPEADEEEAEHEVAQVAAERLVADGMPVVLVAADIEGGEVSPGEGPWAEVSGVTLPRVAALYLGEDVVAADRGPRPDPDEELQLSWFDTTELEQVIALAASAST